MDNKLFLPCAAIVSLLLLLRWSEPVAGAASSLRVRRPYDSIFSFGDSLADTGNNPVVFDWYSMFDPVLRPPYGSTFFGRPTGRNCDGRLIIDFLAQSLDLPFVPPFLAHNGSFRHGANFAVGGATALDVGFFHDDESPGANQMPFNTSLSVQLQWFETLKPSLCNTTQKCRELFSRSLFFVGPFAYNDYSILLWGGRRSIPQVTSLVPDVIATISMATERLIQHGATSLVVPGVLPIGCAPPNLVMFEGVAEPAVYDSRTGCLIELNDLSTYHNSLLRQALHDLQAKHPDVEIIYIDFFGPVMEMVESPAKFGFEGDVLTICCGGPGNKYHFDVEAWCGDPAATMCKDPSARLFWDGVHMTEAANRYVAGKWLRSIDTTASVSSR
ncbi:hypothetical protein PR202_ga24217 [Eleusine coracana subsp. coracana]|uniref:GDSL esterase/lipase n=1 Tax=Eleusine coracana subsp. coracana TaxID=191504 RepID=A0AAV5D8A4_ELECO|nr:hypothetical protein QOZ80_1BG0049820 [Eleusine coracana subsp. coracana]GJN06487.1 hypothetical protein PR202_ga24217 [Eleusine coracana subsp. coracana]